MTAPTVDEMLASTDIGNGLHRWALQGGSIQVTTDELRPALEEVYDPQMPDWPVLIGWDDEEGAFVVV